MGNFIVIRNDLPIFETHLNDGEAVFLSDDGSQAWIGAGAPAAQQVAEASNAQVTTPGLFIPYEDMTVEELKGLLRDKDMLVSGDKSALVARLSDDFSADE